jgi:hypothetical protein
VTYAVALLHSLLCLAATAMRCITTTAPAATYIIHAAQILNGIAGSWGRPASPWRVA